MHQQNESSNTATDQVVAYLRGLLRKEQGLNLYEQYKPVLEKVTPIQIFTAYHKLFAEGTAVGDLLDILDKSINVFHKSLRQIQKPVKPVGLADYLHKENQALLDRLQIIRDHLQKPSDRIREELLPLIDELQQFDDHYLKKENVLFPYLEQKAEYFQGLGIMWALHDEIRLRLRQAGACLDNPACTEQDRHVLLGRLIFGMHGMVLKEELILLPAAQDVLDAQDWQDMLRQSAEFSFPFLPDPPDLSSSTGYSTGRVFNQLTEALLQTETGSMTPAEIEQVFAALPVDVTFVDAGNKVRFFSRPRERIFPRSSAIIGRSVENCHPPQSVDRVLEIIQAFRDGRHQQASFWIRLRGRLILIQYFAVRDKHGGYMGTLEVSQDITDWQQLEGERRLISWKDT
jgi:DUF438 domain-containing protein